MPSKLWDVETWAQLPFPRESQNVCELRRIVTKQRMLGLLTIKGPNNNSDTEIGRLLVIVWRLFHAILQFKGFCRQIVPLDLLIKVFF